MDRKFNSDIARNYQFIANWDLFFWAFSINIILFTWHVANPLPMGDAWSFINSFISKIFDGTLGVTDFFSKRMASDHSIPLIKFMLYTHVKLFSMDFMFDAIVSMLLGLLTVRWIVFWLVRNIVLASKEDQEPRRLIYLRYLTLVAIPFSIFSMNDTSAYTWPLVGQMFFVSFTFIIWFFVALADEVKENKIKHKNIMIATGLLVFLFDNLGMLSVVSGSVLCTLIAFKRRTTENLSKPLFIVIISTVIAKCSLLTLVTSFEGKSSTLSVVIKSFDYLASHWHDMIYWITIPAASSLIRQYWVHSVLNGGFADFFTIMLGILVLVLHFWFWVVWWTTRETKLSTVAALIMLYAYLSVISIIIFRVPEFGLDYLNQPRYIVFSYQIPILALLIQLWHFLNEKACDLQQSRVTQTILGTLLVMYLGLQSNFVWKGWDNSNFVRLYQYVEAENMLNFSSMTESSKIRFSPEFTQFNGVYRKEGLKTIGFLTKNKLSVFSPEFQLRHNWLPIDSPHLKSPG